MPTTGELERAELLGICFLASAVRKLIKQYEATQYDATKTVTASEAVLEKVRSLLGMIMVGSLDFRKEDRQSLLPNGADLYESVRAYNYARQIWSDKEFSETPTQNHKDVVDKAKAYVKTVERLKGTRRWQDLTPQDTSGLHELSKFMLRLEDRLLRELNSATLQPASRI